jgi:tetratricopeptide (TPR) repeat protein
MTSVPDRPSALLLVPLFIALYAGAGALSAVRDRVAPRELLREAVLYVPSPAVMDRMVLSYDALAADIYWIRAIQHFGGTRRAETRARRFELLYPLLNITTALDPKFNVAYRFGAIFLSEQPPGGPGRPDLAITLLERGLETRPDNWRYMQDIGFVHYMSRKDYAAAAEWFDKAADVPDAPWWLRALAANTRAVGGDRAGARALWTAIYQSASDNEWLRNDAARRLQQLDAMDAADHLQRIVNDWLATTKPVKPYDWQALVRAGRLRGVPVDPAGAVFHLGPYTGTVEVADDSSLRPLPDENAPRPQS